MATLFIYACAKDGTNQKMASSNYETEIRGGDTPVVNPVFSGGDVNYLLNLLGSSCAPVNYDCIGISSYTTINFTLPSYPGCTFSVAFKYETCYGANGKPYAIRFTDFILADIDCPAFVTAFNNAVATNTLGNFMFNFNEQVYSKMESYIIGLLQSNGISNPCLTLGYYKSTCYQFCYGTNTRGKFVVTKKSCGYNACCERKVDYCDGIAGSVTYQVLSQGTCITSPFVCPGDVNNPIVTECLNLCN